MQPHQLAGLIVQRLDRLGYRTDRYRAQLASQAEPSWFVVRERLDDVPGLADLLEAPAASAWERGLVGEGADE